MIHTSLPRNCVVFLLLCELTRSAIYKWPTVLVDEVRGKPCNFEACLCGSLYSTFTTSFYLYAFYKKRLQTLFKDQLDRSKATCSFNCDDKEKWIEFQELQKKGKQFHLCNYNRASQITLLLSLIWFFKWKRMQSELHDSNNQIHAVFQL